MRRFVGIGAQKCASSWLYDILADHPAVSVSTVKEVNFFSYHYENGYKWYGRQFNSKPKASLVGEISPSYFNECSVPARVKLLDASTLILVSLRDPVERALSQHRHMVRIGRIDPRNASFEDALRDNPSYLEQGMYARHMARWYENFPKQQIKVVLMQDIKMDPDGVAGDVYSYLDIDPNHTSSSLHQKSNESYAVKYRTFGNTVETIRSAARSVGLGAVWSLAGNVGLQKIYRKINRIPSNDIIPPVLPETIAYLKNMYRQDTLRLQDMVERDLCCWL
ncbi:hypothetical protein EZJ19_03250 [Parasulfuritortus cantonensis]|uniref:Sulfotransferase domain-containing protein n=1 Tax=Parasulfuritortus cantonensis TaxID=2528202 RepID=A0A4R1BKM0_9PROT|nr:sulfotransferase domain-containing protein [Parasulfuritortus cantonensis]TCJ17940.1 hypothetical protein EZJ19_03250 [Parasulfuritortus cantonensis]